MVALGIIFLIAMRFFKQHRVRIFLVGLVLLCLVSGVYTYTHTESILKSRQPFNQTFYSDEYIETGEFPDAFLRLLLKDKKVYVKNDRIILEDAEAKGYYWLYAYYHVDNMIHYLNSVHADVIEDESLNDKELSEDKAGKFERLGYLNDLLRNTVMYTQFDNDCGNYLFYLWYYRELCDTSYIYLNPESLDEDELVLIWQKRSDTDVETEDMYLCGKQYYEENIR